jgi:ABC-type lipoprotein export system ATPase subunit
MRKVYNDENNTVFLETNNGITFNLRFRGRINIILGDSGSGKTFICNYIEELRILEKEGISEVSVNNIITIDIKSEDKINNLKDYKNSLIIIDHADLLLHDSVKIVKFINGDYRNRYLIFARGSLGFKISPNYFAQLKKVNKEVTLEYRCSMEGWY